ncbi:MAG: hypothetical protein AB8B50_16105 [Pirellulaceae bacterium]
MAATKKPPKRRFRLIYVFFALVFVAVLAFGYFQLSSVSGVELNTRNWRLRSFSFRRDPLTNFQWTGVRHRAADSSYLLWSKMPKYSNLDGSIQRHLIGDFETARWDLVEIDLSTGPTPASILVDLLGATNNQYDSVWKTWSQRHPKRCRAFWISVQALASLELYSQMPPLFEIALSTSESTSEADKRFFDSLRNYIDETLSSKAEFYRDSQPERAAQIEQVSMTWAAALSEPTSSEASSLTEKAEQDIFRSPAAEAEDF